jgi:hypothetical protein
MRLDLCSGLRFRLLSSHFKSLAQFLVWIVGLAGLLVYGVDDDR